MVLSNGAPIRVIPVNRRVKDPAIRDPDSLMVIAWLNAMGIHVKQSCCNGTEGPEGRRR